MQHLSVTTEQNVPIPKWLCHSLRVSSVYIVDFSILQHWAEDYVSICGLHSMFITVLYSNTTAQQFPPHFRAFPQAAQFTKKKFPVGRCQGCQTFRPYITSASGRATLTLKRLWSQRFSLEEKFDFCLKGPNWQAKGRNVRGPRWQSAETSGGRSDIGPKRLATLSLTWAGLNTLKSREVWTSFCDRWHFIQLWIFHLYIHSLYYL